MAYVATTMHRGRRLDFHAIIGDDVNIAALTKVGIQPAYLSINHEGAEISVTVRGPAVHVEGGLPVYWQTGTIVMTVGEWQDIVIKAARDLGMVIA